MTDINESGQSFPPHPSLYSTARQVDAQGMSLRDWFAGQALASICSRSWGHLGSDETIIEAWAKCAYATADAMLAARHQGRAER